MSLKHIIYILLAPILVINLLYGITYAEENYQYLIEASPKHCKHGLHSQPNGGPFSVFLFCDDALGSNIGVILTEPGAGPGKITLSGTKVWDKWNTISRFWQEKEWATDVVNFAWSPSLRYLYVATSGIYGDGGLFKLDLKDRTFERILPNPAVKYLNRPKMSYMSSIERIDVEKKSITVGIYLYGPKHTLVATEVVPLE